VPVDRTSNVYMQIIPTTGLQKDFFKAEERIEQLKVVSKWIQVDVCDNVFAQGKTFELELINKIDGITDSLLWDIHLMVREPIVWLNKCIFVGAARVIGEVEMMSNREEFVTKAKDEGLEVGLAFDIETEIGEIPEETDVLLLMGRKAGFEAMNLNEKIFEKIKILRQAQDKREKKFLIAVDGGVNLENIKRLVEAGVDVVYSEESYFQLINDN
jgi:ribulose-phosphate 3-epimerase